MRLWARGQLVIPHQDDTHDPDAEFDEALAAMGLVIDESDPVIDRIAATRQSTPREQVCYLWPCNQLAWNLWHSLQTQWRVGMAGYTGLDYQSVIAYLRDVAGISKKDMPQRMGELQAMECAALEEWDKQRKKNK